MPPPPRSDAEALLAQTAWIRRLAGRLVADAELADDLSQETVLRALETRPRTDVPLRGWLATVMRNLLSQRRRGEARRRARELRAARPEVLRSAHELVERVATQRELAGLVLELDEPYRSTVILRYLEDEPPRRIASIQGVPVATVKTRLGRALAILRARLEARDAARAGKGGERAAWLPALVAVAQPPRLLPTGPLLSPLLTHGALLVNAKLVLTLVLVAAAGTSLVLWTRRSADPPAAASPALAAAPAAELPPARLQDGAQEPVQVPAQRESLVVAKTPGEAGTPSPAEAAAASLRGRVIDVRARPVPGVRVGFADGDAALPGPGAETDGAGRFELARDEGSGERMGRLRVENERWTTVLFGTPVRPERESVVVVAPRISLEGRVVDASGVGVGEAEVRLELPEDLRARIELVLDHSVPAAFRTTADAQGRFALERLPAVEGAQLAGSSEGFETTREPASLRDESDRVLVLERPSSTRSTLSGVVVDPAGAPVEGARVSFGLDVRITDAGGRFAFDLDAETTFNRMIQEFIPYTPRVLQAVKEGFLPARMEARAEVAAEASGPGPTGTEPELRFPSPIVLRLSGEPLSIEGRVVDAQGAGLPGVRVWVADPTFFGALGDPTRGDSPGLAHVEEVLAGAEPGWNPVETDGDGRFELEGLLDRDYVVAAMDALTLQRVEAAAVRAGRTNVELVLSVEGLFPRLRGRVVDRRGEPLSGIDVFPMCDAFRVRLDGEVVQTQHEGGEAVRTGEDGLFELVDVPRDLVYLRLDGADSIPMEWGRHVAGGLARLVGDRPEEVEIVVERRAHFQVELSDPDSADEVAVENADGRELEISDFQGNSRREGYRHPLVGGRSTALAVGDSGTTLVLFRDGVEVRRLPLHLVPGERATVRP